MASPLQSTLEDEKRCRQTEPRSSKKHHGSMALTTIAPDRRYSYDVSSSIRSAFTNPGSCCPNEWPIPRTPANAPSTSQKPAAPSQRRSLSSWLSSPAPTPPFPAPSPPNTQPQSPLFARLPLELRRQIYAYLLVHPSPILCVDLGGLPPTTYALTPALLQTCRLALHEAAPVLYSQNRFAVNHIPNLVRAAGTPPRFVVCPRYFGLVRYLSVDVPDKFIPRFFATEWGDEYEGFVECVGGVVRAAGRGLRHVQLRLVRNCALESYTSWGPYLDPQAPIMRAITEAYCPAPGGKMVRRLQDGANGHPVSATSDDDDGYLRKLHLLVPCQGCEGPEVCFDAWRPDAPAVVHCIARNLGALQRTAALNGWPLEDVLRVRVNGKTRDGIGSGGEGIGKGFDQGESKAEMVVNKDRREVVLEIEC